MTCTKAIDLMLIRGGDETRCRLIFECIDNATLMIEEIVEDRYLASGLIELARAKESVRKHYLNKLSPKINL